MKKYFPVMMNNQCSEPCYLIRKNVHIGSVSCQECKHNKGHGKEEGKWWIYCDKIDKARDIK